MARELSDGDLHSCGQCLEGPVKERPRTSGIIVSATWSARSIHPHPEGAAPYKGQCPAPSLEVFCDCVRSWCAKVLEALKVTYGHKGDSLRG